MKRELFLIVFALVFLHACGHTTKLGISYRVAESAKLEIATIRPDQIDAAWLVAQELWGFKEDQGYLLVTFWDKPISAGDRLYAGATWGTDVNVYINVGSENCMFREGNAGALLHELSHALLYLKDNNDADTGHVRSIWQEVGPSRRLLELQFCPNADKVPDFTEVPKNDIK